MPPKSAGSLPKGEAASYWQDKNPIEWEDETMAEPSFDPRPGMSAGDLIREAIDESRALLQTEVALARDEVRDELRHARTAAVAFGTAALLLTLALALLLTSLVLALVPHALWALVIGLVFLCAGSGLGLFAYRQVPRRPMEQTRARLETDAQVLKETLA
jgi:uncharacterized membrane protein YqjE